MPSGSVTLMRLAAAGAAIVFAACGGPASTAGAQGANPGGAVPAQVARIADPAKASAFEGVRWTVPAGLKANDAWRTACPSRCVAYQGEESHFEDEFPLVIVHEPALGSPRAFFDRWKASHEKDSGDPVTLRDEKSQDLERAKLTLMAAFTEGPDGYGGREASMIFTLERDGLSVPVEIQAFDFEDLPQRMDAATAVLESVQIDLAAAKAALSGNEADTKSKNTALMAAYGKGESVQLYMQSQIQIGTRYGMAGMEMTNDRTSTIFALLPGGVLLTEIPDDFQRPDLARMKADGTAGTWTKSGGGFQFVMPDGTRKTARLKGKAIEIGGEEYPLINPLTPQLMAGRYATIGVSSAGGMGVGQDVFIASRSDSALLLRPDGKFEQSRDSFTSVTGSNIGGGTGSNDLVSGRWSYDPKAYTLTLKPDDGTPPVSGPFFCYFCESAKIDEGNWDWNVFGGEKWWRDNGKK